MSQVSSAHESEGRFGKDRGCNVENMSASVGDAITWEENSLKVLGIFLIRTYHLTKQGQRHDLQSEGGQSTTFFQIL